MFTVTVALLLLVAQSGYAIDCHQCRQVKVMSGEVKMNEMVEDLLGGANACAWRPRKAGGDITCQEACKTSVLTFSLTARYDVDAYISGDVEILIRGCGSSEDLGCETLNEGLEGMVSEELKPGRFPSSSISNSHGGMCVCDGDDMCNRQKKEHIPLGKMECVSCGWAEASNTAKQEDILEILPGQTLAETCLSDPESMPTVTCDSDSDVCATMTVEVDDYKGLGHKATLYRRGCVNVDIEMEKPRKWKKQGKCQNVTTMLDQVAELLETDDYDATRGGICFCPDMNCNTDNDTDAWRVTGAGVKCQSCMYATAKKNSDAKEVRNLLSNVDSKCQNNPGDLKQEECDRDEICASVVMPLPNFDGSPLSEGEVHWRGCIDREMARMPESDEDENDKKFYSDEDDEEEDYHSCHSTRHYQDLVEEVFPTEVTDDAEDGGVCFCEDNRCNVQQSETVQEADDLVQCVSCAWVEANRRLGRLQDALPDHFELTRACRDDPDSLEYVSCKDSDEICASLLIDSTSFKDINKRSKIWMRGCVNKGSLPADSYDGPNDCYDGTNYIAQFRQMLGTDQGSITASAICLCDEDGCNEDHSRSMLTAPRSRGDCVFDCDGIPNGFYHLCGKPCRLYVECDDEEADKRSCTKGREWDTIEDSCMDESATCP